MKQMTKSIVSVVISAMMIFTAMPFVPGTGEVHAASAVGRLNGTSYSSYKDLTKALEKNHKNGRVTIEMLCNWNAAGSDDYDRNLVIPEGCTATLRMHGYVINRNRAAWNDSDSDGEVIFLSKGSTLEIFGGENEAEKKVEHPNVATYYSTDSDDKARKMITTYGGTITGGCGSYGSGGIHMRENSKVILNDVTIAGCSTRGIGVYGGIGGGIYMKDDGCKVIMNDSTITGCFADVDGGGIYANGEPESIELNHSVIDRNYAEENGGGIYTNNQKVSISGRNGSVVSNNEAREYGGGICVWYGECSVSGLEISGNKSKKGGGVHLDSTEISLSGLNIHDNRAERGAGIAVHKDKNTISGCEITGNTSTISGGGVYVDSGVDTGFTVSGKTIIRGNSGGNFYFSDNNPTSTRCDFKLTKGSDVRVHYWSTEDRDSIMVTNGKVNDTIKTPNCIQYLHSDDPLYHFNYNDAPNQKKIYFVRNGKKPSGSGEPYEEPPEPTQITPANAINSNEHVPTLGNKAGVVGTLGPGGTSVVEPGSDNQYDLIRGFSRHEETDSDTNDSAVAFYYSDAFFDADPYKYNNSLATASLNMAYAGMYLRAKENEDSSGNYYYNRHAAARQFMADIGCPDQKIYVNDSNEKKPQTDSIGVTIASKELAYSNGDKTGYTLIPIVVRGGGYELEWASNATLNRALDMDNDGKEAEAKGFSNAADQVMDEIERYIDDYGLRDEVKAGHVKFWISGYSRAGATSNITAKRLVERYADGSTPRRNNQVFAYTCEAPMGGTDIAEKLTDKTKYYCIHNMVNAVDIVPLVAPKLMGFKRYGLDHYIPGTDLLDTPRRNDPVDTSKRSGDGGPSQVTTYQDNDWLFVKTMDSSLKKKMLAQLKLVDSGIILDDYYHPMVMDVAPKIKFYEDGDYGGNHIEWFVRDFLRFAQVGKWEGRNNNYMKPIPDRPFFANTLQQALRDSLALVMTMDADTSQGFIGRASSIMDKINTIGGDMSKLDIYFDVISGWCDQTDAKKEKYYTSLWDILVQTGALDFLSESDRSKLQKNWPALANMAFTLAHADHEYHPSLAKANSEITKPTPGWANGVESTSSMMLLGTFASFSTFILQNHYPEVNLAWARAYDNLYNYEEKEYETLYQGKASGKYSVNMPAATAGNGSPLVEGEKKKNLLSGGDQTITLEVEDIVGEAIYYDLIDEVTGRTIAANKLYRGGVDIARGTGSYQSYMLRTYAISYGVRSGVATYNLTFDKRHLVVITDGSGHGTKYINPVDNETVTLAAAPQQQMAFAAWKVTLKDVNGKTLKADISETLLGNDRTSANTEFTMPEANEEAGYPEGYGLDIQAICGSKITVIEADPAKVVTGTPLQQTIPLHFYRSPNWDDYTEYPVTWSYIDSNGDTVIVPDPDPETEPDGVPAYEQTQYTATITIPEDEEHIFAPVGRTIYDLTGNSKFGVPSVSKNEADGSVVFKIMFNTTYYDPDNPHPRPDTLRKLTCGIWDMNLGAYDVDTPGEDMQIVPGRIVTLTAPGTAEEETVTPDSGGEDPSGGEDGDATPIPETMNFVQWDFDEETGKSTTNPGITLYDGYKVTDKTIKVRIAADYEPNPDAPVDEYTADINALYRPAVNRILAEVNIPEEETQDTGVDPAGGQVISDKSGLFIILKNMYKISEDSYDVIWSPEPLPEEDGKKADYLTAYTVTIRLKEGEIKATQIDSTTHDPIGDEITLTGEFDYAKHIFAYINGYPVIVDTDSRSISYTFPTTKYVLRYVDQPADIRDVEHGSKKDDIEKLLPEILDVTVEGGMDLTVPVTWDLEKEEPDDPREETVWTATANVELPDTIEDRNNVLETPVTMHVIVNEAEHAVSPEASLPSETYFYDQWTTLSTKEEDGTIYYATGNSDTFKEYDGEEIEISRDDPDLVDEMTIDEETGEEVPTGRKMFVLKAYTSAEGKFDSAVVTYAYVFDNEIDVPEGNTLVYNTEEQTGLSGSNFYTVESVNNGGKVNDDGEAVAVNAGKYEVTLKIKDGYKWVVYRYVETEDTEVDGSKTYYKLSDDGKDEYIVVSQEEMFPRDEDGEIIKVDPSAEGWVEEEKDTLTDDQIVEFTIGQLDLTTEGTIVTADNYDTMTQLKEDIKVTADERELPASDYDISYSKVSNGKVTVTVTGSGTNCIGKITKVVSVAAKDQRGDDGTPLGPDSSEGAADDEITNLDDEDDPAGTRFNPLRVKAVKQGKNYIKLKWNKPSRAVRYVVYGSQCGTRNKYVRIADVKKTNYTVKKIKKNLKKATYYKFIVLALDKDGNVVTTAKTTHASTKGNLKKSNPKKVIVKAKVNSKGKAIKKYKKLSRTVIKKGKKVKLRGEYTKARKAKVRNHVGLKGIRFESTNTKIATVTKKGVVKAKKKGKCFIYVFAQNGAFKKIKITVK